MASDPPTVRTVPPDIRAAIVSALAAALVAAWRRRHAAEDVEPDAGQRQEKQAAS